MFVVVGLSNNPQPQGHKDAGGRQGRVESDFPAVISKLQIGEKSERLLARFKELIRQEPSQGKDHVAGNVWGRTKLPD